MDDDRMDVATAYGKWRVRASYDHVMPGHVWISINTGAATVSAFITAADAIGLAGRLLAAAGHDDPIPTGEATESDFGSLEAS